MAFLKGDKTEDDRQITDAYLALKKRFIPEYRVDYLSSLPKIVWKASCTYQCIIRRTIDIADGLRSAWNAGNVLTAITMGRSLVETGSIAKRLSDGIRAATEKRDVEALDSIVMNIGFATRLKGIYDEADADKYKAQNILTAIEKMDKKLFRDKRLRLSATYEFLSEFAHPNHLSLHGLYNTEFHREYRNEFGITAKKKTDILPNLRVALNMVWLVNIEAKAFDEMMPTILDFCKK